MNADDPQIPPAPRPGRFLETLGVRSDEPGTILLDVGPEHLRSLGIAHGGVVATLLDSVMGWAAGKTAMADHYLVTAQLNVNFIRPAFEGETLVATARISHQGQKTAVTQGEVKTSSGALVATASATFLYLKHTERTRSRIVPRVNPA